jgi:hypothetical protein
MRRIQACPVTRLQKERILHRSSPAVDSVVSRTDIDDTVPLLAQEPCAPRVIRNYLTLHLRPASACPQA